MTGVCRRLAITLICLMVAACGGDRKASLPSPTNLQYPQEIVAVRNVALASVSPTVGGSPASYAISDSLPAGLSFNTTTGVISGTPTALALGKEYTITATNSAGSTTAKTSIQVLGSALSDDRMTVPPYSPIIALSNQSPLSGEMLTVTVRATGATSIDLNFTGDGCGALAAQSSSSAMLATSGKVAATGECAISATVKTGSGTETYTGGFEVSPAGLPDSVSDINFTGGVYFPSKDAAKYLANSTNSVTKVEAPQHFSTGGAGSLFITVKDPARVSAVIAQVSGFPGYFVVPATLDGGRIRIDMEVAQKYLDDLAVAKPASVRSATTSKTSSAASGTAAGTVTVRVLDDVGKTTNTATAPIVYEQPDGDQLQFSLSFADRADLDLHVDTPAGEEIYFGRRQDRTGGFLDANSNAACAIDNRNTENIGWSKANQPQDGHYIVRIDYHATCGITAPVAYLLTVKNCGNTLSFRGTLLPTDADNGGAGSGNVIANITFAKCPLSVAGTAFFEKVIFNPQSGASTPGFYGISAALVEVRAAADNSLLATGATDLFGKYSLKFAMPTPGPYTVRVLTEDPSPRPRHQVENLAGAIYAQASRSVDGSAVPEATGVDIRAMQATGTGQAFNIYNIGFRNTTYLRSLFAAKILAIDPFTVPTERSIWQKDSGALGCRSGSTCYTPDGPINISGSATDLDENDDSVIAHEWGHFVTQYFSAKEPIGGAHDFTMRSAAPLAWSEGVATFWGQMILNSRSYIDNSPAGLFGIDIEVVGQFGLNNKIPLFTSNDKLDGDISEVWVAAILWDLWDNNPDQTSVANPASYAPYAGSDNLFRDFGTLKALFDLRGKTHNRGAKGVDLADYLDQSICSGYFTFNGNFLLEFGATVVGLNHYNYTIEPLMPPTPGSSACS